MGVNNRQKKKNWQYTARREPVHRTEDGIRVVDIEEQYGRTDNAQHSFSQKEEGGMEFQYLMNQMNKTLQESSYSGSGNPSQNFSSNEGLNQVTSNATSVPRRVGSVIRMLPHKQITMQKTSVEPKSFGDPSASAAIQSTSHPQENITTTNPLDTDNSLADYLSQTNFNHPVNNSIPRESDIIKQELMSSNSFEAERIAEKLKVMLAPLASQQDRNNSQIPDQFLPDIPTMPPLIINQDQTPCDRNNSDLLEIITQDLVFSLEGARREEKLVSALKDEVPSTSS